MKLPRPICYHILFTHNHRDMTRKGNVKVKLTLCLMKHRDDVWGSGDMTPPFLTSLVDEDEWSGSRPGRFTYEGAPSIH
jgi:hypothetical protein